jgi:hypothetical protein
VNRWLLLLVTLATVLSGCGGTKGPPATSGDLVKVTGTFTDLAVTICEGVRPDDASGLTLTFLDSKGAIIGTATTGETTRTPVGRYCAATAPYSVELPRLAFYQARVPGLFSPETISYQDLAARNFVWDVGARA